MPDSKAAEKQNELITTAKFIGAQDFYIELLKRIKKESAALPLAAALDIAAEIYDEMREEVDVELPPQNEKSLSKLH